MRKARMERNTKETQIVIEVNLDGTGQSDIHTGIGFLDHMLTLLAFHSEMDLLVRCQGDLEVDSHHSVEDIGIALGKVILEALGDKKGIYRYGHFTIPMDEALSAAARMQQADIAPLLNERGIPSLKDAVIELFRCGETSLDEVIPLLNY